MAHFLPLSTDKSLNNRQFPNSNNAGNYQFPLLILMETPIGINTPKHPNTHETVRKEDAVLKGKLEARTFAPRRRHLRPMEPGASTLGGGTFDPRSPGLRKPHAVFW